MDTRSATIIFMLTEGINKGQTRSLQVPFGVYGSSSDALKQAEVIWGQGLIGCAWEVQGRKVEWLR